MLSRLNFCLKIIKFKPSPTFTFTKISIMGYVLSRFVDGIRLQSFIHTKHKSINDQRVNFDSFDICLFPPGRASFPLTILIFFTWCATCKHILDAQNYCHCFCEEFYHALQGGPLASFIWV